MKLLCGFDLAITTAFTVAESFVLMFGKIK
jgi:hypothetical protein